MGGRSTHLREVTKVRVDRREVRDPVNVKFLLEIEKLKIFKETSRENFFSLYDPDVRILLSNIQCSL